MTGRYWGTGWDGLRASFKFYCHCSTATERSHAAVNIYILQKWPNLSFDLQIRVSSHISCWHLPGSRLTTFILQWRWKESPTWHRSGRHWGRSTGCSGGGRCRPAAAPGTSACRPSPAGCRWCLGKQQSRKNMKWMEFSIP